MDKRRRARVQGGWAAPSKPSPKSDGHKTKVTGPPSISGQQSVDPQPQQFVYQQPTEAEKNAMLPVAERTIDKAGVYDISTDPSGVARIRYFPDFIETEDRERIFQALFHELPWRQRSDVKDGQEYLQPRLTAWFGEHPYSYSGLTHEAHTDWNPTLLALKRQLEEATGLELNAVLANLYRDGRDHVPWHSDDEPGLGPQPTVASISLGDTRMFDLRKKPPEALRAQGDYSRCEVIHIPLAAGSLLIMEGATQDDWHHRISREYHDRGPRINLTFRVILPVQ